MLKSNKIIVMAPCYNEKEKIKLVVERLQALSDGVIDEILIVDDGSTDGSAEVVESMGVNVLRMGACIGAGAAIREGLFYAREKGFDIMVVMAGNNKDEPKEIIHLLQPITDEGCHLVQGSRYLKGGSHGNMPFYRKIATRLHPFLFSVFVGKRLTESTNGFRAIKLSVLDDERIHLSQKWLDEYELEPYLLFQIIRLGYKHKEVPCTKVYPPKKLGQTKMKPITGWWSILRPIFLMGLRLRR